MSDIPYMDEDFELEDANEDSDDLDLSPADFEGLVVAPADWTVETIYTQIGKQIDLDPDFQRRNVWSKSSKSRFIESLLLGIPIPQILLSDKKGKRGAYIVLDGKQRLLTIKEYMDGRMLDGSSFRLSGLRILPDLNGMSFEKLADEPELKDRLLNETVRTTIVKGWEKQAVLYEIFYRLNTGSVRLSPMELRMSLYPGDFLKFIVGWTETVGPLHEVLRRRSPDKRMADVEIAVRHLAFQSAQEYDGNLKKFLDNFCDAQNRTFSDTSDVVNQQLKEFDLAIQCGMDIFPRNRFCRKFTRSGYESRFNRAIFDVLVGSLVDEGVRNFCASSPEKFKAAYEKLCLEDREFVRSVETSTKNVEPTRKRFEAWYDVIRALTGIELQLPNIVVR